MAPTDRLSDRHIVDVRRLVAPSTLLNELPLAPDQQEVVLTGRLDAASILRGEDDRLLVIVGPCSVHDPASALDYARRLRGLIPEVRDELAVIMRVYFEKPRSALGWKGLINDPGLDGSNKVNDGLFTARSLLLEILSLGVPVACEFLEPITPQYIADTVSWGAIGARTAHSQIHRQLASGLSMPVGFKNSTEGDVQGAVDAVLVASRSQVFPGITYKGVGAIFTTAGNPDCHVVLRGSTSGPNHGTAQVGDALERLEGAGLVPRLVIDASHGNSGKDHRRQPVVASEIAARFADGERGIAGVMLESFLVEGRQELVLGHADELRYGQSITDSCMGWQTTVDVVRHLARATVERRSDVPRLRARRLASRSPNRGDRRAAMSPREIRQVAASPREVPADSTIDELRQKLDAIDGSIVRLLAQRRSTVTEIASAKGRRRALIIRDLERERHVLAQVEIAADRLGVSRDLVRSIFTAILEDSVAFQTELMTSDSSNRQARSVSPWA